MAWVNADVHAWSKTMSQVLRAEMPNLAQESQTAVTRADTAAMKAALPAGVWPVINKIESRKGATDGDLCGVNPLGMLQIAWEVTPKDADGQRALVDLLTDIGGTCLQGDTHRLFFYIRAVRMSDLHEPKYYIQPHLQ